MRQVDEQNAVAEVAMLELEEQVRVMLPEDEEDDGLPEQQEDRVPPPEHEPEAARRLEEIGTQLGILLVQGQILMDEKKKIQRLIDNCGAPAADEVIANPSAMQKQPAEGEDDAESWGSDCSDREEESRDHNQEGRLGAQQQVVKGRAGAPRNLFPYVPSFRIVCGSS
jgi:hypothetical protein